MDEEVEVAEPAGRVWTVFNWVVQSLHQPLSFNEKAPLHLVPRVISSASTPRFN